MLPVARQTQLVLLPVREWHLLQQRDVLLPGWLSLLRADSKLHSVWAASAVPRWWHATEAGAPLARLFRKSLALWVVPRCALRIQFSLNFAKPNSAIFLNQSTNANCPQLAHKLNASVDITKFPILQTSRINKPIRVPLRLPIGLKLPV